MAEPTECPPQVLSGWHTTCKRSRCTDLKKPPQQLWFCYYLEMNLFSLLLNLEKIIPHPPTYNSPGTPPSVETTPPAQDRIQSLLPCQGFFLDGYKPRPWWCSNYSANDNPPSGRSSTEDGARSPEVK